MRGRNPDWLNMTVALPEAAAAAIYAGMMRVALADGVLETEELALLKQFGDGLATGGASSDLSVLDTDELKWAYLRSLLMVALADGEISEAERTVVNNDGVRLGIEASDIALSIVEMKRYFIRNMSDDIFVDAVLKVATEMGMSPEEIERHASAIE